MNRVILYYLLILSIPMCLQCQRSVDVSLLEEVNFIEFCDKEIGLFLNSLKINEFSDYTWVDEPPGIVRSVLLRYEDGQVLEIFVGSLKYQDNFKPMKDWSFELFQKEPLKGIILWNGEDILFRYSCSQSP